MKSFNNWIFIELKEFGRRRRLFVIICLADASKRPVKRSNPSDSDAINLFANENFSVVWCLFRFVNAVDVIVLIDVVVVVVVHRIYGRYAEWVGVFCGRKPNCRSFVRVWEGKFHVERWPFAMISFIFCWGNEKKKELPSTGAKSRSNRRRYRASEVKSNLMGILRISFSVAIYEKGWIRSMCACEICRQQKWQQYVQQPNTVHSFGY